MYKMGIIEESLRNKDILKYLEAYLYKTKIQHIPGDEYLEWHVNEYHIVDVDTLWNFLIN